MFLSRQWLSQTLVGLAALMLPVQTASGPAGCCDRPSRTGSGIAQDHSCCHTVTSSPGCKCRCEAGCSCACGEQSVPASAPSIPSTRQVPGSRLSQAVALAYPTPDRPALFTAPVGSLPEFSVLSPSQHCVCFSRLQL